MNRPLLLVDAASMYFRAYFGIPESAAMAPDGTPVNAVRGFLDMLATLVRTRRPDRVVCALDEDWRPAWRVALVPSYKSHRLTPAGGEEVPDALSPQVPKILDLLAALGITAVGAKDYEADDVIGTLATREPGPIEVATGDRDLFQLIDDARGVVVLYTGRGVAKLEVLDDAAVRARYGVAAAGYADYAALRGDPSDGLPGVAGVGEKTAARLVDRYGGLDAILEALDDPAAAFAPGVRAKLLAGRDYLGVARPVVAVARDVPLPALSTALPAGPVDPDRLLDLAEQWNVAGSARRLVDAMAAAGDAGGQAPAL
ncbi:MAG TPA: 5'-3' exonuclease [Micromonosporaceae bacterium]|nr:5'-3' exonuclease [Micromonosporaceae bacterium]